MASKNTPDLKLSELNSYSTVAIHAAAEAGIVLMNYYGNIQSVKYKDGGFSASNIVTEADIESEKTILSILQKEFPKHSIYSEECGHILKKSRYRWYVDPLDGTSNYSRNIPLFGISIGLMENDVPILGVLYFPRLQLLVSAEKDRGTFANKKKVHVSDRELKKSLYYSGGKRNGVPEIEPAIYDAVGLTKIINASSYELAQIAMGDAEIYALPNVLHDVAAGIIIVQEAGGKVTDKNGNPWTVNSKDILVTNGKIHQEVVDLLKR